MPALVAGIHVFLEGLNAARRGRDKPMTTLRRGPIRPETALIAKTEKFASSMGRVHVEQKLAGPESEGESADKPSLPRSRPVADRRRDRHVLIVMGRPDCHVSSPFFAETGLSAETGSLLEM
jgi:hypothetical protein